MVPTDTHGRSGYVGDNSVTLTYASVVDGRPDWPSRAGRRHRRNVWCECSSKSTHCSKVHGSYHPRTTGPGSFTRRPVWMRRASHPAPSGRPPRGGAKVTWFRYSCEYLGILEKTPVLYHPVKRAPPAEGQWTEQVIADSTAEDLLWPGATQRPGHQLPCVARGPHQRRSGP